MLTESKFLNSNPGNPCSKNDTQNPCFVESLGQEATLQQRPQVHCTASPGSTLLLGSKG